MKKTLIAFAAFASGLFYFRAFGQIIFQVTNPAAVQGIYSFAPASGWGGSLNTPVTGFGVLVDDGTAADSLGCNPLVNGSQIAGNIAFVYRGTCEFGEKALRAQNAGAIAVVVINNVPGTVPMGAGSQGGNVTIPVVMISQENGQILRPYLDDGTLELFIGSKLGIFANDLGMNKGDIIRPLNSATPSLLVPGADELQNMRLGGIVRNLGSQAQSNVSLNAKIFLNDGTTPIYDQTSTVVNLNSGDSAFFSLPNWTIPNADVSKYTLKYTAYSDSADADSSDNIITQDFFVTNSAYSKARYDEATGKPIRTAGITSSSGSDITWGILMNAVQGDNIKATGIQFSASTLSTDSLTGEVIVGILYEWNDENSNGVISDDELVEIAVGFYSYESNLQGEVVTIDLSDIPGEGPGLAADKIYYIAVQYEGNKTLYFGMDEELDYNETINAYEQSINPLKSDGTWYGGGFGSGYILSVALNTAFNNVGTEEEVLSKLKLSVYPNPASDVVNVVFGNPVSDSDVHVRIIDVAGRAVLNKQFAIGTAENFVSINTAGIAPGSYYLNVSINGKVNKTIPLIIAN